MHPIKEAPVVCIAELNAVGLNWLWITALIYMQALQCCNASFFSLLFFHNWREKLGFLGYSAVCVSPSNFGNEMTDFQ
jgi:hypothetical protein